MNFFEHQDKARKQTFLLITYFGMAVFGIVLALYLVAAFTFPIIGADSQSNSRKEAYQLLKQGDPSRIMDILWNPELLLYVAGGTCLVIFIGSLFKTLQLGGDGSSVATMLGGIQIIPDTQDPEERKILNVVEEMAIASGLPVPPVFVMNHEDAINAFAAGTTPEKAVIGVTRGCISNLTRDELQGVIAHEFSHILNGDMRINIRLIGVLGGILGLTLIGRILLRFGGLGGRSSSNRKNNGAIPFILFGLAMIVIGFIGVFFANLIKSAVSRQREFLADASAVQFTRNPDGLAGALKKIGALSSGSRIQNPSAEEASHLFFGEGIKSFKAGALFSTHPPLTERVRRIEPGWDGTFPEIRRTSTTRPGTSKPTGKSNRPSHAGPLQPETLLAGAAMIAAGEVSQSVGSPTLKHLDYARALIENIPEPVREATHQTFSAGAVIYCLLFSKDKTMRQSQLDHLQSKAIPGIFKEIERLYPQVKALPEEAHLPLVDMCIPALRLLSMDQFRIFRGNVQAVIESDQEISLFEYTLQKLLMRHLEAYFEPDKKRKVVHYYSLKPVKNECAGWLSLLAHEGSNSPKEAQKAFQSGARFLKEINREISLLPPEQCSLSDMDTALEKLNQISMPLKRQLIDALATVVTVDEKITRHEAELLRAVADGLECPIPPFLTTAQA